MKQRMLQMATQVLCYVINLCQHFSAQNLYFNISFILLELKHFKIILFRTGLNETKLSEEISDELLHMDGFQSIVRRSKLAWWRSSSICKKMALSLKHEKT